MRHLPANSRFCLRKLGWTSLKFRIQTDATISKREVLANSTGDSTWKSWNTIHMFEQVKTTAQETRVLGESRKALSWSHSDPEIVCVFKTRAFASLMDKRCLIRSEKDEKQTQSVCQQSSGLSQERRNELTIQSAETRRDAVWQAKPVLVGINVYEPHNVNCLNNASWHAKIRFLENKIQRKIEC